ncbi:Gti1/Pac2 family-domain-containing protein [Roridomyces roridus]|uniref:Gti1/Pac2 family-domain-containing protein n=1 Tax=Roridomyces roridus TaxID=1738132 RepID=A0AAD7BN56_9AGAR|nr:Gti1/Pac2 family-domain-containing protein [Roridomyces roridus]
MESPRIVQATYIWRTHCELHPTMQRPRHTSLNPTHPALHIRNSSDVLVVLEAVRRGILPLITRRLSASERDELESGHVFVWEEAQEEAGLVRWTDGRKWSQSKVCGDCLLYQEKVEVTDEEREDKARRRVHRICNPGINVPSPRRNQRPSKAGGLTKQTYSFIVRFPGSRPRKWHVVSYSAWTDRGNLPVIGDYPALRDIQVPVGVFSRSKSSDTNLATAAQPGGEDKFTSSCRHPRLPISNSSTHFHKPPLPPTRRISIEDDVDRCVGLKLPSIEPGGGEWRGRETVLPPISCFNWPRDHRRIPCSPVFLEDRRVLDSFKLCL